MSGPRYFNPSGEAPNEQSRDERKPALSSNHRFRQMLRANAALAPGRGRGRGRGPGRRRGAQNNRYWNQGDSYRGNMSGRDNRGPAESFRGFQYHRGGTRDRMDVDTHQAASGSQRGPGADSRVINIDDEEPESSRHRRNGGGRMNNVLKRDYGNVGDDVNAPKRKRYIIGGRIPKYEKKQEYKAESLYCEVCDEHFRDDNAQMLHINSKKHNRNMEYEQNKHKQVEPRNEIASLSPAQLRERIANSKFPPDFREWANRSIQAAKQESERHGDPLILQSVQKEVIDVFMHHSKYFTLKHVSWSRHPKATGENFREVQRKVYQVKMLTEEQAEAADRIRKPGLRGAGDNLAENAASTTGNSEGNFVSYGAERSIQPSAAAEAAEAQTGSDEVMEVTDTREGNPEEMEVTPVVRKRVQERHGRILPMNWRVMQTSVVMKTYFACHGDRREEIVRKTRSFAPPLTKFDQDAANGDAPLNSIMEKYRALRSQFDSKTFVYRELRDGLLQVFDALTKRGTRKATSQSCLQMLITAAIDGQEWGDLVTNGKRLVQLYKHERKVHWDDIEASYIVYWLLSWLFRPESSEKKSLRRQAKAGAFEMFDLVESMREFPHFALCNMLVFEAVQVFRAFMSNDYYKFFKLYKEAMMHIRLGGRSQYLMDEMAEIVRERAIVTMTMRSCLYDESDEQWGHVYPQNIDLGHVIGVLGWKRHEEDEQNAEAEEAKEFIQNLSQDRPKEIVILGDDYSVRSSMVSHNANVGGLTPDELINVDLLVRNSRVVTRGTEVRRAFKLISKAIASN